MSDVIQLLPDSVANQIAAGEVIQRPASVVKELVENSIDAGATQVEVVISDAGRSAIRVIDNGKGMSETDARLAFERHATSKIRKADDLFSLHTMGFRGEALPSIAAVAQVELLTRTADEEIGTRLTLAGTHVQTQEPAGCPVGSSFLVENLFFNVPARRKFLKSNATELNNILQAFERIVLVYPDIQFSLTSDHSELRRLRPGTLKQRIVDLCGKRLGQDLLPIDLETSLCTITGFVGRPESARKKGANQYFFVNGRYMRHPYFHKAVLNAYERLVPQGTQVPYFIYFTVPPQEIDVNIHPTKTEIKFENEQDIFQMLHAAVHEALGRFCGLNTIDFDQEGAPEIPVFDPSRPVSMPQVQYNPDYNPFKQVHTAENHGDTGAVSYFDNTPRQRVPQDWQRLFPDTDFEQAEGGSRPTRPADIDRSMLHYQFRGRYIFTTLSQGLLITDQHRASVRVLYEKYMRQLAEHRSATQQIIFPEVMEFAPSETIIMEQMLPTLENLGFSITHLGGGSFSLSGVPAGVDNGNDVQMVRDIVSQANQREAELRTQMNDTVALALARVTAIPEGQLLNNDEMEQLVSDLLACENTNYTPDGKPISNLLSDQMLGLED